MVGRLWRLICVNRKPFITLLILAAIVIIPPTRYLLGLHLLSIDTEKGEPSGVPPAFENPRKIPRNASEALELGRRDAESTKGRSYSNMIVRYPNDPALYAGLLRWYITAPDHALSYARVDSPFQPTSNRPSRRDLTKLAGSREMLAAENAIRMGRRLEPDNAFFDLMDAHLLYGRRRDVDALAAIRRAARKGHFNPHIHDSVCAYLDYGPKPPFPVDPLFPVRKAAGPADIDMSYLAAFRSSIGLALAQSSEKDRIVPAMSDVIRVGELMRNDSCQLANTLVGVAIQKDALLAARRALDGQPVPDETVETPVGAMTALFREVQSKAQTDALPEREWLRIRKSVDRSVDFHRHLKAYGAGMHGFNGMFTLMAIYGGTQRLLENLWVTVLLWIPAAIWLLARRKTGIVDVGPRALWIILPSLVLGFPVRFAETSPVYCPPSAEAWIKLAIGFSFIIPFVAFLAAVVRPRVLPDVGRADTIFARFRRGCIIGMKAILVLYALTVVISIPVAVNANRQLDARIADEPALVWQMKP